MKNNINDNMSEKIKMLRQSRKMTLEDVALKVGVGKSTVRKWETGIIANMRRDKIQSLADALGTTPGYLMGWEDENGISKYSNIFSYPEITDDVIEFPVLGDIAAGFDHVAYEDFSWEEKIKIPTDYIKGYDRQDFFVLRVTGDSMYPLYIAGDKVLIRRQSAVDSGAVAAVLYDGECATIKKVELSPGAVRLVPVNPLYQPQTITGADTERCTVLGIPVLLIRQFNDENNH